MTERILGVIGGSGLYSIDGLTDLDEHRVETTFGAPSDVISSGRLGDTRLLFLPRHGRGHRLAPHEINYRANILALKTLGAEQVISVSAVGSMREDIHPGEVVLVDQFIDRTHGRANTFFEGVGAVAHVGFSDPVDANLMEALYRATVEVGARAHRGGTYICIQGPQFSTRAESNLFRSWGVDVIGMTNLPEARLAREAGLPYATMAMVTDYDCWHTGHDAVSVESVLKVLQENVDRAKSILKAVAQNLPDPAESPAPSALEFAVITPEEHLDNAAKTKLAQLLPR